jgi:hypothetical protein
VEAFLPGSQIALRQGAERGLAHQPVHGVQDHSS